MLQCAISFEVTYQVAAVLIKFSVLSLYARIFGTSRRFLILLWGIAIFVSSYSIAQIFLAIFQCIPMHKVWNPSLPGRCVLMPAAAVIPSALNSATDVVMVSTPLPLIWGLNMQRNRKIQILGMFMLGYL